MHVQFATHFAFLINLSTMQQFVQGLVRTWWNWWHSEEGLQWNHHSFGTRKMLLK